MPELETPRLILKVPVLADLDGWAALDSDPEATRFIGGVQTRRQARDGLRRVIRMWDQQGHSLFSVFEKSTGRWVGRTGPWVPKDAPGNEVGWAFLPSAGGQGYATEAARAAIDWAFEALGWDEVIHCIHPPNLASIAVARKLGSTRLRSAHLGSGEAVEIYGQSRGG